MRPIIENSLSEVGAIKVYDNVMGRYQQLPFVPDVKANLIDHVVDRGMEGIFHYIAEEEAAIRKDPVKQSTELLKKVFGKNKGADKSRSFGGNVSHAISHITAILADQTASTFVPIRL